MQSRRLAMRRFESDQAIFARALLNPDVGVPPGVTGPDGHVSARRFSVYRNNVVVGLIDSLAAAYPVVRRLVGEAFFHAMARVYALQSPPSSPVLLDYGNAFPEFIATFAPAASLAYLADVARLERLWIEAYHAAECQPMAAADLEQAAAALQPTCRLKLHPSIRLLHSAHPVLEIWHANVEGDGRVQLPADFEGEDILISRSWTDVELRRLPPGSLAFIRALLAESSLITALQHARAVTTQFEPQRALAGLFEAEIIVEIRATRSSEKMSTSGIQ